MTTKLRLVLFFTRGVSLQNWAQIGSLEREIALYIRLQEKGVRVSFVTYGNKQDLQYEKDLQGIEILCNCWNLPAHTYEYLQPLLHGRALRQANLIKTNQTNGAELAWRVARFWHKPFIARCGYMWSDLARSSGKEQEARRARSIEHDVFTHAAQIIVTTASMQKYVIKNYGITDKLVHRIPNYVLVDSFSPGEMQPIPSQICFIGRLSEEKNLFSLIQACVGLDVNLHFIGGGELELPLREKAKDLQVRLKMHGNLLHHQLPDIIRQSAIFVLVSPHEGHPKSLLEAMSCGTAVIGADSPGIREQIVHGETGWLVGTDSENIRAGIQHLLANPSLREKLGINARQFILDHYSLDKIVEMEYSLIQNVIGAKQ